MRRILIAVLLAGLMLASGLPAATEATSGTFKVPIDFSKDGTYTTVYRGSSQYGVLSYTVQGSSSAAVQAFINSVQFQFTLNGQPLTLPKSQNVYWGDIVSTPGGFAATWEYPVDGFMPTEYKLDTVISLSQPVDLGSGPIGPGIINETTIRFFLDDGRVNTLIFQPGQTAAIYCHDDGSVSVFRIDENSRGVFAFKATLAEIEKVGIPEENTLIDRSRDGQIRLYRLTTGEFQVNAPVFDAIRGYLANGYVLIWNGCEVEE